MPEMVEWQMWRQLKGAFAIDQLIFVPCVYKMDGYTFEQADTIPEALSMISERTRRIFLEPKGAYSIHELYPPKRSMDTDVTFILGNTESSNLNYARNKEETVRIDTPGKTDLYGINAAAIALAYWHNA